MTLFSTIMDREKGGTYELGAFISENIPAAAAEMQKFFGGAGDIGSFVRWATSEILAWINEAGPLAATNPGGERESQVMIRDNTTQMDTIRRLHLSLVLESCLETLRLHNRGYQDITDQRNLGWKEFLQLVEEVDWVVEPRHLKVGLPQWSGQLLKENRAEHIYDTIPQIIKILLSAKSSSRLEYALELLLPVILKMADWPYTTIPHGLWLHTLRTNGMTGLANDLQAAMIARDEERLRLLRVYERGERGY